MRTQPTPKPKTLIPKGVATFLPEGVLLKRAIEREIFDVFFRSGYQEVITPLFEYLDVFTRTSGEDLIHQAYKFVDRATGRIMVLRPDVTPQIARMAATLLADRPRPLRLCYSANLFRHEEEHAGQEREIFQMGGELIGPSGADADAEMMTLVIEILRNLKIKSKLVVGHIAFTRGVLTPFESNPVLLRKILNAVARKETTHLERLLKKEGVGATLKKQVLALPTLFGGKEVFIAAKSVARNPLARTALKRISDVYRILTQNGFEQELFIDLSEVRGFDYYTGIVFEVFAPSVPVELGGGGRYDHLIQKFGAPSPSIGFALNIERVQQAKGVVPPSMSASDTRKKTL